MVKKKSISKNRDRSIIVLFDFSRTTGFNLTYNKKRREYYIFIAKEILEQIYKYGSQISLIIFRTKEDIHQIVFTRATRTPKLLCAKCRVNSSDDIIFYSLSKGYIKEAFDNILKRETTYQGTDLLDPLKLAVEALINEKKRSKKKPIILLFSDGGHVHCSLNRCDTILNFRKLGKCCENLVSEIKVMCKKNKIKIYSIYVARPENRLTNKNLMSELSKDCGEILDISEIIKISKKKDFEKNLRLAINKFVRKILRQI